MQVVIGLLLGVLTSLFLGEWIEGIGVVGTAYVRLLQMTILPYIMVSLVRGFGGLTRDHSAERRNIVKGNDLCLQPG